MILLYPETSSVSQGGTLTLHISSDYPAVKVKLWRLGAQWEDASDPAYFQVGEYPLGAHDSDFGWPAFSIDIPDTAKSGVYVAVAERQGSSGYTLPREAGLSMALFVVTSANPGTDSKILYKVPLFTYHAYNELGDPVGSFYTGTADAEGFKVSMKRPGGGVGAVPWDSVYADVFDGASPRQTFQHWDQKFIMWLEANDYEVDYCTDLDVHLNDGDFLSNYNLIVSVGHDEYWTEELRNNLEAFRDDGGNIAFFSGNVCWWRAHLVDGGTALTCQKAAYSDTGASYDQWWNGEAQRPENSITGVSYRNGGGGWYGQRDSTGYSVQYPSHWVFDGVVRQDGSPIEAGDIIGGAPGQAIVGYECDGAALGGTTSEGNVVAAANDDTPYDFLILGVGPMAGGWNDYEGDATATMGIYQRGGLVFTAATTDWARLLDDPQVEQITENVLEHLRLRRVRVLGLGGACSKNPPIEGAEVSLYADPVSLPGPEAVTHKWTASAGTPSTGTDATFELTLPSPPESVTVTVQVSQDGTPIEFGSLTFLPMTDEAAERMQLICQLRQLIQSLSHFTPVLSGSKNRFSQFVDPLWDPIRGELEVTLSPQRLRGMIRMMNGIAETASKILDSEERGAVGRGRDGRRRGDCTGLRKRSIISRRARRTFRSGRLTNVAAAGRR